MRRKQVDIRQRYTPIPIAVLVKTANSFDCDIYIDYGKSRVNVKDYDEIKRGLMTRESNLLFYFDGRDEADAEGHIIMLFQP